MTKAPGTNSNPSAGLFTTSQEAEGRRFSRGDDEPVSLAPLTPEQALKALLATAPRQDEE